MQGSLGFMVRTLSVFAKGISVSDDDIARILAAIEELKKDNKDLRQDNTIAHKDIVSMIEAVQKTQKDHTRSLGLSTVFITGELPRVIDEIAKAVGIQKTGLADKIIELSRKAEAAEL